MRANGSVSQVAVPFAVRLQLGEEFLFDITNKGM
jgi:hypothetical protein